MHGVCIQCNRARGDEYLKYSTFAIHTHETHLYILHFYITCKTHTKKHESYRIVVECQIFIL